MPRSFRADVPGRIVFAVGAEERTCDLLEELGAERVLLLAQAHHRGGADRLAAKLGARAVRVLTDVQQHVPTALAEDARRVCRESGADFVLAHGGGSAIGLAKVIALTEPIRIAAVPTTYAGSERTNIWGLTGEHGKQTGRDDRVRPSLVVYDPALTLELPRRFSLLSLFNALAHAIEALYDPHASEGLADEATQAATSLVKAVRAIAADPLDLEGRTEALYGAYLAGTALDRAQMALHHKLAHVLGGTFGTPHAATHAVLLPHVLAYNGPAAPDAMARLSGALGDDPPAALHELAREVGVPVGLRALGLRAEDLDLAAHEVMERIYPNPRPLSVESVRAILEDAWLERRPSLRTGVPRSP
jgi:maleylacetate reductase